MTHQGGLRSGYGIKNCGKRVVLCGCEEGATGAAAFHMNSPAPRSGTDATSPAPLSAFAAVHVFDVAVVFLAHVLVQLFTGGPPDEPAARPRLGVSTGVIDGRFVLQGLGIQAGK